MTSPTDPTDAQRTDNTDLRAIIEEWGEGQVTPAHASAIVAAIVAAGWVGPRRMRTIERLQAVAIADWEGAYGELRRQLAVSEEKYKNAALDARIDAIHGPGAAAAIDAAFADGSIFGEDNQQ